jgi:TolA protein
LTFGPVYSVSLVGPEIALPRNQESSLMKEIEKSNETAGSIIFKREISSVAATPAKKEESNRSNIEKAISSIRQKELATPEKSAGKSVGTAAVTSRTKGSETAGNANSQQYIGLVWTRIQKNWTLPPTLMPRENIEAIVAIRIARSGALEFADFEKRSGNRYFDDAALKAVKKSSPFPPFPGRMTDSGIEIGIRFHPAQFR